MSSHELNFEAVKPAVIFSRKRTIDATCIASNQSLTLSFSILQCFVPFLYPLVCYGKRFGPKGYGYGQGGGALQSDQNDVANGYVSLKVCFYLYLPVLLLCKNTLQIIQML